MRQANMSAIVVDVYSVLEALSDPEIRYNALLMTKTAKVLRLITNVDLEESTDQVIKAKGSNE